MKIYVVTAEVSYIRCDTPRDEAERKGTHIQGGFKTAEEAEKCIQDKIDEVAKLCETEPMYHHDFTRYTHGCHWLDTFTTKNSDWCVMERVSAHFEIEDIEVPGL